MSPTTTPQLGAEFPKQVVNLLMDSFEKGIVQAAQMLWDILLAFLFEKWFWVLLTLFVLFVFVTLKAMMGRWGSLGSFLYNFFYFGILLIIGLIWGPEVFVDDYFNTACAVILYPTCYVLSGMILNKMGVRGSSRLSKV